MPEMSKRGEKNGQKQAKNVKCKKLKFFLEKQTKKRF